MTTENADAIKENGVVAVGINNTVKTAQIMLMKDTQMKSTIKYTSNVLFNLNGKTLGVENGTSIQYLKDFRIKDGTVHFVGSLRGITGAISQSEQASGAFLADNVKFINNITNGRTLNLGGSYSKDIKITNCIFNVMNMHPIYAAPTNAKVEISNCNIANTCTTQSSAMFVGGKEVIVKGNTINTQSMGVYSANGNNVPLEDENSLATYSVGGLILSNSGMITSNYWLSEVYDAQITNAHKNGDLYIHNIHMLTGCSAGWSLEDLILHGLPSVNKMISSLPAKHLSTLCNQMVNFLGIMQNEWASAQSLAHFDTLLVPFIHKDKLSKKMVYDCLESFIYGINIPSRWGTQAPFSQITLDWNIPKEFLSRKAIVAGLEEDFTYADCQVEMKILHDALFEVLNKGDISGRGFQFPIVALYLHENFDWMQEEELFKACAKYGTPYFLTQEKQDVEGYFGYKPLCGSMGVVTLNLVRLAYLSSSKDDFFKRLDNLSDVAIRSFEVKRQVLNQLLEAGLYPYTKAYISDFNDYYGTLGVVGMNEACLNAKWLQKDLMDMHAQKFAQEVLNFLNQKISNQAQKLNLEATPAESVCTHFAKMDKEKYPEIQSFGYYTNSTHLDVASTDDVFEALRIQQRVQTLYSGATSFPVFMDHGIENWKMAALLVKTIYENYNIPVFTITPTYSVCTDHGYVFGKQDVCPICQKPLEIYSRVSGYYRNLEDWNEGKQKEFSRRKTYSI